MDVFQEFVKLGYLHILTGYDHLLFLLGLIIVTKEWKSLFGVITAFTVTHSTTLVLSALNVLSLPSLLTESLIALSIMYVGIENTVRKEFPKRWFIAGAFGLIHGAGFSGHLVSILKPLLGAGMIWPPILGFNIGIEFGQFTVILLAFPLVMYLRRTEKNYATLAFSYCIAAAGLVLLVLRLAGIDA